MLNVVAGARHTYRCWSDDFPLRLAALGFLRRRPWIRVSRPRSHLPWACCRHYPDRLWNQIKPSVTVSVTMCPCFEPVSLGNDRTVEQLCSAFFFFLGGRDINFKKMSSAIKTNRKVVMNRLSIRKVMKLLKKITRERIWHPNPPTRAVSTLLPPKRYTPSTPGAGVLELGSRRIAYALVVAFHSPQRQGTKHTVVIIVKRRKFN